MSDTFDPTHIRAAVAHLDAPGIHPEVARMIRAHAEKVLPPEWREDIAPAHSVTDYAAGSDGWLRITRRPAPPPLACGVCGTIGAPHAHPNRAQRRAARGRR